jgi:hypothetical protein
MLPYDQQVPTVAEYMAHGMKEADAIELVKADRAFSGARQLAISRGWKVNKRRLTAAVESQLYAAGYRPVLLNEDGTLRLCILGVWVQPHHLAELDIAGMGTTVYTVDLALA